MPPKPRKAYKPRNAQKSEFEDIHMDFTPVDPKAAAQVRAQHPGMSDTPALPTSIASPMVANTTNKTATFQSINTSVNDSQAVTGSANMNVNLGTRSQMRDATGVSQSRSLQTPAPSRLVHGFRASGGLGFAHLEYLLGRPLMHEILMLWQRFVQVVRSGIPGESYFRTLLSHLYAHFTSDNARRSLQPLARTLLHQSWDCCFYHEFVLMQRSMNRHQEPDIPAPLLVDYDSHLQPPQQQQTPQIRYAPPPYPPPGYQQLPRQIDDGISTSIDPSVLTPASLYQEAQGPTQYNQVAAFVSQSHPSDGLVSSYPNDLGDVTDVRNDDMGINGTDAGHGPIYEETGVQSEASHGDSNLNMGDTPEISDVILSSTVLQERQPTMSPIADAQRPGKENKAIQWPTHIAPQASRVDRKRQREDDDDSSDDLVGSSKRQREEKEEESFMSEKARGKLREVEDLDNNVPFADWFDFDLTQ